MRVLDGQVRGFVAGAGSCALVFLLYFSSTRLNVHPSHLIDTVLRSNTTGEVSDLPATTPSIIPATAPSSLAILDDIQNATLGFEKIFAISMASRTDQRDALTLTSAYSELHIDIIDGVTAYNPKAMPPTSDDLFLEPGALYAYRAHLNVISRMVEQNISSALILEGDVDWDVHVKSQMRDFAKAAWALVQPLSGTEDEYLDPTYPHPKPGQTAPLIDLDEALPRVTIPTTSPYGDLNRWDVLWIGHCGARFPTASNDGPIGQVPIYNDPTVLAPGHFVQEWGDDQLVKNHPPHTRVVSRARDSTCTLAYALSQQAARNILYRMGIIKVDGAFDMMLHDYTHDFSVKPMRNCLSVQPPLFNHHHPVGSESHLSDIHDHSDEGAHFNEKAFTSNIRYSARVNLPQYAAGHANWIDSYPDDA